MNESSFSFFCLLYKTGKEVSVSRLHTPQMSEQTFMVSCETGDRRSLTKLPQNRDNFARTSKDYDRGSYVCMTEKFGVHPLDTTHTHS